MSAALTEVDVLVLDFDGTVHDDAWALEAHLAHLRALGQAGVRAAEDATAILDRRHPVPLGSLYEPTRQLVRPGGPLEPDAAVTWSGSAVADAPPADLARAWCLGDWWQVTRAAAAHAGLDQATMWEVFVTTRRHLIDPAVSIPTASAARRGAAVLPAAARRVLVSNTPDDLARPLLHRLELTDAFDDVRFGASKPDGLAALLDELIGAGVAAEAIAVVGDNLLNDVLPGRERGCRTVLVDPRGAYPRHAADVIVASLVHLADADTTATQPR